MPDPKRILVIDDAREIRELLADLFEEEGYRVVSSDSPLEPAGVLQLAPDLIVLDLRLGGEDVGWDVLQRLREDPTTASLPIVLCTAAMARVRELGPSLAAMDVEVVTKPFDLDELLDAVTRRLPTE